MGIKTPVVANERVFVAVDVPETAVRIIRRSLGEYPQYIKQVTPDNKWHVTLAWLGEVENPKQYLSRLTRNMRQGFVPTIRVNHVGRGLQRSQLWAYVDPATVLTGIRDQIFDRLGTMRFPDLGKIRQRQYVPHIHVADLFGMAGGIGLADEPAMVNFAVKEAKIYRSCLTPGGSVYEVLGTILLSD